MSRLRRDPATRRRVRAMPRVRVHALRMMFGVARGFQWKRSDLYTRVAAGSVEGGLKEI